MKKDKKRKARKKKKGSGSEGSIGLTHRKSKENLQPIERSLDDFIPMEIEKVKPGSVVVSQGGEIEYRDKEGKKEVALWGYNTLRVWPGRKAGKVRAQTPWLTMVEFEPCYPVLLTPLRNLHYISSLRLGKKISSNLEPPKEYLQALIKLDEGIDHKKFAEAKKSRGGRPPKDSSEDSDSKKGVDWSRINKGKVDKKFQKEQVLNLLKAQEEVTLEEIVSLINLDKRKITWLIKGLVRDGHRIKTEGGKYHLISSRRKDDR